MPYKDGRCCAKPFSRGKESRKKVQIGWEIYKTGELVCQPRHYNNKTFLGDVKNPIAIGKKGELWKNLDAEFFHIVELWRWKKSRLLDFKADELPYPIALGIRYLTEVNHAGW